MPAAFSMMTLLGLLGALQGLVLAGVLASFGGFRARPNLALAAVLALFSAVVAAITVEHAGVRGPSLPLILIEYSIALLFPPALWHYADTVLGGRSRGRGWLHLLPAMAWLGYLGVLGLGWLLSGPPHWVWRPPITWIMTYMATYTALIAWRTWQGASASRTLIAHRGVLQLVVALLILLHIAQLVRYMFRHVPALADIVPLTGTLAIYIFSVYAFRQSRIFSGHEPLAVRRKYESSTLTAAGIEENRRRLLEIMDREAPYRNENLNLSELARRLKLPRSHLSRVINEGLETTFPEFLNGYRVREAARLLADGGSRHLTVEAIGYEVGFRSRSGFHGVFKRLTGETPAQARARLSAETLPDT